MLHNFEILREHRQFMEQVREERRQEEQRRRDRTKEEDKALRNISALGGDGAGDAAAGSQAVPSAPGMMGQGNMYQRCAALEEHVASNETAMQRHRMHLDEVHAVRKVHVEATGQVYNPLGAVGGGGDPIEARARSRKVQEDSRWMGPAMQGAAYSKALATEMSACQQQQQEMAAALAAMHAEAAAAKARAAAAAKADAVAAAAAAEAAAGGSLYFDRQVSDGSAMSADWCAQAQFMELTRISEAPPPFPSRPGTRPQSAHVDALRAWGGASRPTSAASTQRPLSAAARGATPVGVGSAAGGSSSRPLSAAPGSGERPRSLPSSRPSSRPSSAGAGGSMKARCRALEDNMKKTQAAIKAHRCEIEDVQNSRKGMAARMAQALHDEFSNFMHVAR